jgi:hypothetical protein
VVGVVVGVVVAVVVVVGVAVVVGVGVVVVVGVGVGVGVVVAVGVGVDMSDETQLPLPAMPVLRADGVDRYDWRPEKVPCPACGWLGVTVKLDRRTVRCNGCDAVREDLVVPKEWG